MKLRNILFAVVWLAPMFAHADANDGFYVDGSFGRGGRDYDPTTNVINVDAGYHWSWFAVEAGYVDFKRTNSNFSLDPIPLSLGYKENGFTAGVAGHWDIVSDWYLSARMGAIFWHDKWYESAVGQKGSAIRNNGTSWYAGVGVGYDFTKNFSLGLTYDWYNADQNTARVPSLKAEVRF
jgi:OOP family OmpA-OmpF porin/outer membrane immunogenic protein